MKRQNRLQVIECGGTPYEIGRQYGEAAKENVIKSAEIFFSSLENGFYKAAKDRVIYASQRYLNNVRIFDADSIERVKGMAEGAGLSFDEVFAIQCWSDILVNYPGLTGMCTSFAVAGAATRDGITIIGQNVDWHPEAPVDLVRINHPSGIKQLCLYLSGYGSFYLNSEGIGNCANLTLCPMGQVVNHVPFVFYMDMAMRQKTVSEAMDVLSEYARGIGYYHVADGMGNMSGIESIYDDYTIIRPVKEVLVHANHYETEKYQAVDVAKIYIPDSFSRADRLRELINNIYGSITPELMMATLSDHAGHPDSLCHHVDVTKPPELTSLSVASFIMIPAERVMYVSYGPPCENEYVEYIL